MKKSLIEWWLLLLSAACMLMGVAGSIAQLAS
jgi:hypothetical protein